MKTRSKKKAKTEHEGYRQQEDESIHGICERFAHKQLCQSENATKQKHEESGEIV